MKKILRKLLEWEITKPIIEKICEFVMGEDLDEQ